MGTVRLLGDGLRREPLAADNTLDAALANRFPDVELVTAGGSGVPALAASYAHARDLPLVAVPLDYAKHRGDAEERRGGRLGELADAAVVVWEDIEPVRELVSTLIWN